MADLAFDDLIPQQGGQSQTPNFSDLQPSYRGSILPFSTDAQGNPHLDWSAGLPGALWSAVTAPGDAYLGKLVPGTQDAYDRAAGAAMFMSPTSAAMRAGEALPGMFTKQVAPTAQQLKTAAGAGYDAARNSGLDISGDAVANMARGLQQGLTANRGIIEKTAPKTFGVLDELANPPAGGFVSMPGLLAAKSGLSNLSLEPGTEGLAARDALGGLRSFMSSVDNPQLAQTATGAAPTASPAAIAQTIRDADANYATAQRSNDLTGSLDRANTGILERAEARAEASHSGRNLDNAIRQRVASFLQTPENLAGFSQPEIDALKGVVAGGPVQNAARFVGNLLGGGGGAGSLFTSAVGLGLGHHFAGPEGGEIGMLAGPSIGIGAKTLENALAARSLNKVDELIRSRSPLYDAMRSQGLLSQPAALPNNLMMRGLLPSLTAPPGDPADAQGAPGGQPIPAGLLARLGQAPYQAQ